MIGFRELDFWLAKGFGGIINMLHTRVTQIPHGFASLPRKQMTIETRRLNELNDAIQANPDESEVKTKTDLVCLDNWFIQAFVGLDRFLNQRCEEGPTPIHENNLRSIEDHITRLQLMVAKERAKCPTSRGQSAA